MFVDKKWPKTLGIFALYVNELFADYLGENTMNAFLIFTLCLTLSMGSFSRSHLPTVNPLKCDRRSTWQALLTYEGRDLRKLNREDRNKLFDILRALLPNKDDYYIAFFFSKLSLPQRPSRYILVEGAPLRVIPGRAKVRVNIFDADGNLLAGEQFSTGWRIALNEARLVKDSIIGVPVIEISTGRVINGRDVARQYYGLLDEQVVLLRLEDSEGKAVRNMYTPGNYVIGPPPPDRTVDEWQKGLMSNDRVELLQALMWFAGTDGDLNIPMSNWPIVESDSPDPRHRLRGQEPVKERLRKLRESKNRWVSEAAELAMGVR